MHRWAVEHKIELESRNRGSGSHLVQSQNARDYLTSYPQLNNNTISPQYKLLASIHHGFTFFLLLKLSPEFKKVTCFDDGTN